MMPTPTATSAGSEHAGLRFVFSLFLGLMVTAFIGVAVATFHPSPTERFDKQVTELRRARERLETATPDIARTPEDRRALQDLLAREGRVQDEKTVTMRHWLQVTSVILILFATLVMAIAVWRADRLAVIGNGLLLGGVFTMLYGAGMAVIATETMVRFLVITGALTVTIILGYHRFVVRRKEGLTEPVSAESPHPMPADTLEERITALEHVLHELSAVLRRHG